MNTSIIANAIKLCLLVKIYHNIQALFKAIKPIEVNEFTGRPVLSDYSGS